MGADHIHRPSTSCIVGLDDGKFTEGHELDGKWRSAEGDGGTTAIASRG